jgi:hypothetical protein
MLGRCLALLFIPVLPWVPLMAPATLLEEWIAVSWLPLAA